LFFQSRDGAFLAIAAWLDETYPLDKAPEAYDRMMGGKARFRVVLETRA
jgi:D-arabinose 1-dehydrogenase-like Zn-dependent alcohol dehydrogenase